MDRRRFLELAGVATAASVGATALMAPAASADEIVTMQGSDMLGWETHLGDGVWAAPGQDWLRSTDIRTDHHGTHSELQANVGQRRVMAHNITFRRDINPMHLTTIHATSYEFALPYLPSTSAWPDNAQTVEGGFFVWDGATSRRDYGAAFQWILNPWMSSFGEIRTWTDVDGGQWTTSGYLAPDMGWHSAEVIVDMVSQTSALVIDGERIPVAFSATPKPDNWGPEIAARLQTEVISLWPGGNPNPPRHRAQFRNWSWSCIPHNAVEGEMQP